MPAYPRRGKRLSTEDANLLLRLNEMQQSDRIFKGWAFSQMEFKANSWREFLKKYPKGTEEYDHFFAVGHFFEVAGVLVKYGLLAEELFFETFYFEPIWKNFEPVIKSMREEFHEPSIEENFELLYIRHTKWKKAHQAAHVTSK